jgi:UDP-3-O-[3-hydroxymyristoyl] glucosamine N-acyltransferase
MPGDPRFFRRAGPHSAEAVAAAIGASVEGEGTRLLHGVAPLQAAGAGELSFLDNRRYARALQATQASAVIISAELAARAPKGCVRLISAAPYLAWAQACALFHPEPPVAPGVHPSAHVDPSATLGAGCAIGAFAVVEAAAELGAGCVLGPHAVVGEGCVLGEGCRIGAHASLSHAILGARVVIHPGARIGQPGFGFTPGPQGFVTVPQLGRVLIGDDVEVGANSTIDRGSAGDTVIGAGTRIDNLVQIGHNVRTGRMCIIVAMAGISGSTVLGDFVQMGAQAGLTGHLSVGDGARIAAQAGVMADLPAGAEVAGAPAEDIRAYMRGVMLLRRLVAQRGAGKKIGETTG